MPVACVHGFSEFAVSETALQAVNAPVTVIVGDRDPRRRMWVDLLATARPDWPVHLIQDAGHLNCVVKPEFRTQLKAALERD